MLPLQPDNENGHHTSRVFEYLEYAEYVFFALYSISMPVYMIFFYILMRHRSEFCDSFFSLCRSMCVADICLLICSQLAWKIPLMGWFTQLFLAGGDPLCTTLFTINQLFSKTSDYCMVDLVLNRLTAIAFPGKHPKLWRPSRVHWAILGQWLLALLIALPTILFGFSWIEVDIGKDSISLYPGISKLSFYKKYWWANVAINCCRIIIYIISTVLIVIKAWRNKKTITPLQENVEHEQYRADLRLAYAVIGMCLVDVIKLGWYIFLLSFKIENIEMVARLALVYENTLGEINSWSKPYIFMAGCPRLRSHFFAMFHKSSDSTAATVSEQTFKLDDDLNESPPLDQTALCLQIPSSSHGNRPVQPQPSWDGRLRY